MDLSPRVRAVCDLDVSEAREFAGRHEYDGKTQDLSPAGVRAGLNRLEQLTEDPDVPGHELDGLRSTLQIRLRRYQAESEDDQDRDGPEVSAPGSPEHEAVRWARRAVIDAQREELLRWRDAGLLPDSSLRVLERELDHEERTFPAQEGPIGGH